MPGGSFCIHSMFRQLTTGMSKLGFWLIVGAFIIALLVINDSSLWDDELIRIRSVGSSFGENLSFSYTQLQPLYISFMWCYEKLVGTGEYALKAYNAVACAIAAAYFLRCLQQDGRSPWYTLVLILHPMVFYYNNEISPYMMLLACASAAMYHLYYAPNRHSCKNILILNAIFLLAYALHFISGFFYIIIAATVLPADLRRRKLNLLPAYGQIFLYLLPFTLGLTALYLAYMHTGQVRGWDAPGLNNIAYVLYSFCGMQGLGLSRIDLRFFTWENMTGCKMALLAVTSLAMLGCAFLCRKALISNIRRQPYILPLSICLICFVSVSLYVHFRFWERHLIYLLPFFLLFVIQTVDDTLKSDRSKLTRSFCGAAALLVFISAIRIMSVDYYHKDDFKGIFARYYEPTPQRIVLCQCYGFSKRFYNIEFTEPLDYIANKPRHNNVVDIAEIPLPTVMQCIRKAANEAQTVRLVLNKRAEWVPTLYWDAEERLRKEGYTIRAKTQHNIFHIIDFSK